jgi:hypothetical protein
MVSLANLVGRRQKELQLELSSGEKMNRIQKSSASKMRGKGLPKKTAQTGLIEQRKVP